MKSQPHAQQGSHYPKENYPMTDVTPKPNVVQRDQYKVVDTLSGPRRMAFNPQTQQYDIPAGLGDARLDAAHASANTSAEYDENAGISRPYRTINGVKLAFNPLNGQWDLPYFDGPMTRDDKVRALLFALSTEPRAHTVDAAYQALRDDVYLPVKPEKVADSHGNIIGEHVGGPEFVPAPQQFVQRSTIPTKPAPIPAPVVIHPVHPDPSDPAHNVTDAGPLNSTTFPPPKL
jgi:hypothetical protein